MLADTKVIPRLNLNTKHRMARAALQTKLENIPYCLAETLFKK